MLPNIRSLIKKHLSVLHFDSDLKNIFPENSLSYLMEIEILKKYYLHHCTLKINMKGNPTSLKNVENVIFVKKFYLMIVASLVKLLTRIIIYIMILVAVV